MVPPFLYRSAWSAKVTGEFRAPPGSVQDMNTKLTDRSTVVVGGSRGLGRGIASAFASAGARVVAVARNPFTIASVRTETADAADPATAARILSAYEPDILVVVAGATPVS